MDHSPLSLFFSEQWQLESAKEPDEHFHACAIPYPAVPGKVYLELPLSDCPRLCDPGSVPDSFKTMLTCHPSRTGNLGTYL